MDRLKPVGVIIGVMLFLLAVLVAFFSGKGLANMRPADSYEDKGVHTFYPYQVLPVQVKNTTSYSRDRRMNPTKTVYMVYYRAANGSGYQWSVQASSQSEGQRILEEGVPVNRRVLSIPSEDLYVSAEPEQTAESYTAGLRRRSVILLCVSVVFITAYLLAWAAIFVSKRRRQFF